MKKIALIVMCALLMVGCEKERPTAYDGLKPVPGGMVLLAESGKGTGSRTTVSGRLTYWQHPEEEGIWVNYTTYGLTVSIDTAATVEKVDADDCYRVVYPASLSPTYPEAGDRLTLSVTLPSSYAWAEEDGRQVLKAPLAGYATHNDEGTVVRFRHLTAAINLKVENNLGAEAVVESIQVSSNRYRLCGPLTFSLTADNSSWSVAAQEAGSGEDALRAVSISFDSHPLTLAAGESRIVQMPVLPVGSDNKFTVKVSMHTEVSGVSLAKEMTQHVGGTLARGEVAWAASGLMPSAMGAPSRSSRSPRDGRCAFRAATCSIPPAAHTLWLAEAPPATAATRPGCGVRCRSRSGTTCLPSGRHPRWRVRPMPGLPKPKSVVWPDCCCSRTVTPTPPG